MNSRAAQSEPEAAPAPVVTADAVTKVYTRGASGGRLARRLRRAAPPTVTALDDVSLAVSPGEVVGLEGPSGSGKSTLLHLLAGLALPTTGTVTLAGTDPASLSVRGRTRLRLEHVGIVFQHFHLLDALSARGNVALPLVELGVPRRDRRRRATALLERVGLGDRLTHRPRELSGGERQRVALARALATDPALLVADEPTGELDTETGRLVLRELEALAADRAVVLASHDRETLAIADRVLSLRDGKLVGERG